MGPTVHACLNNSFILVNNKAWEVGKELSQVFKNHL